jgi:hypothetical protein
VQIDLSILGGERGDAMGEVVGDVENRIDPVAGAAGSLGRSVALLLFDAGWMHRRKDTVELLDDTWVHRKTSVDIAIPLELDPITPAQDGNPELFVVPVTLLPKVPPSLMRFDFRAGDARLTLPTRVQNGLAAYAALLWAAQDALGYAELPRRLREELLFVALGPPEYAAPVSYRLRAPGHTGPPRLPPLDQLPSLETADRWLVDWTVEMAGREQPDMPQSRESADVTALEVTRLHVKLANDPLTAWLLRKFALTSPVVAHVGRSPTGRSTVVLAYDENVYKAVESVGQTYIARAGWAAYPFSIQTPYIGASSYHFEFLAPPGLEVNHSALVEQSPEAEDVDTVSVLPEYTPDESETVADAADNQAGSDSARRRSRGGSEGGSGTDVPDEPEEDRDDDADEESARPDYDFVPNRGSRIHHYWSDTSQVDALTAQVYLRATREAFVGTAFWAAAAVSATMLIVFAFAQPLVRHATGAQGLLLAFPGLLAALVARAGGHTLIIRILQHARRSLMWCGAIAFMAAGLLAFIHTGGNANAGLGVYVFYGVLFVVSTWQATKLWLSRRLPRPPGQFGPAERYVSGVAQRRQRRAVRAARGRQRSLRLVVRAPELTWERVDEIAADEALKRGVPVQAGRTTLRGFIQDPYLCLEKQIDGVPLLATQARPALGWVRQEVAMARRLSLTIRCLAERLPQGYELEIRWRPWWRKVWWLVRAVWRRTHGRAAGRKHLRKRPARDADEVAATARRGGMRLQRIYVISPTVGEAVGDQSAEETSAAREDGDSTSAGGKDPEGSGAQGEPHGGTRVEEELDKGSAAPEHGRPNDDGDGGPPGPEQPDADGVAPQQLPSD